MASQNSASLRQRKGIQLGYYLGTVGVFNFLLGCLLLGITVHLLTQREELESTEPKQKPEEKLGRQGVGVAGQNWYESPESATRVRAEAIPNESQAV